MPRYTGAVSETAVVPLGDGQHEPADFEAVVVRFLPLILCSVALSSAVLWWQMAGRPPHLPPPPAPPVDVTRPRPHAIPTATNTERPHGDSDVGDMAEGAVDTACDCMDLCADCDGLSCAALDCSACDCGALDCGALDCGGLDCGGCDISCEVSKRSASCQKCSSRKPSASWLGGVRWRPLWSAGGLVAPLIVMAFWARRKRNKETRDSESIE